MLKKHQFLNYPPPYAKILSIMILLGAVFLYGCRVQREEINPNNNISSKNLSFLLKVKKWYDTKKMLKSRNDDVSIIPSDYEPDFSASISQKIPCGSNSMFRIPFKDKNDSTKILKHQITKDGKTFTGIPELIIRQNDEDFTVVISVTSTNLENKDDLRENNFFTKSSHFTGVDYFFSPEGTSFLGANPYTNGEYNGELESITCIVICTISGGGSGGSGGVIPQSTGPARIVSVTQVKNTTTNMMTCTTSCIIGGTPTGGGSSGSNGSSGGSNIPSGGGGSGSNTPYNPPKDPTCPTGNCCKDDETNKITLSDDFKNSPCHNNAFQKLKSNPQFKGLIANFENNVRLGNIGFQLKNNLKYSLGVKTKISREASYQPAIENSVFFNAGIQLGNDNDNSQQVQVGLETNEKKPVLIMADILYYTFVVNIMKCTWQGIALSNVNQGNYNVVKASDLRNFFNTYANNPFNNVQKDIYAKLRDNTANTSTILYQKNAGTNLWSVDYQPFYDKVLSTPYFINMMAGILQQADGTMQGQNGLEYYKAIIWNKLKDTPAYNNLSDAQQNDIEKKMDDIISSSPMITPFVQTCD